MKTRTLVAAVAAAAVVTAGSIALLARAADPTVEQLLADHALLRQELDRCRDLGMKAVDDPRCTVADEAERRRFMGKGAGQYNPPPVQLFPNMPDKSVPAQQPSQTAPPSKTEPPHG
ncbi:conjugative transfer region protein TrbK [Nitrospirillum amazonense]|uniref:Conjugative transfer region protein TrbK n=1 Tax=Nitrospirillum amazonense TaxID=28077 RepID=A0A560FP95_9PROT|nr:putative entry exclusion protein TrbK-alt [Nitrospirillum amazonense]TWB23439.1 conjugative transfer region protein TrbK [Nitrospirillum amazonense]